MTEQTKRVYEIKSIYLKDLSFESPKAPQFFAEKVKQPSIDIDINTHFNVLNEEKTLFDVVLIVRVTANIEQGVLFLIDVTQSGIVEISGFSDTDIQKLLNIAVPNVLLPYTRETISSLVGKGGFPPLLLSPINFEHIYREKLKAEQEKKQSQPMEH